MNALDGRVALVTGASSGIGAATARALAAAGARVALASRRGDDAGIAGAIARACDVRDAAQVSELVEATVERFGGLDVVIANAGVGAYGPFLELDPAHVEEMIEVNVNGLIHTVRAALPHLLGSDAAELVVVASVAGLRGPRGESVYAATKFAQVGFMRALDHELYERGVRCSTICPGGVATEFAMGRGRTPDSPHLAQMMHAEEVAEVILHVISAPRTHRVQEVTMLPMSEDSLG